MKTNRCWQRYRSRDDVRAAVDAFFGQSDVVYATPDTANHGANFYGGTAICELNRQDVANLIQIAHDGWTTIGDDGEIRDMTESEAIDAVLTDLQTDRPDI